MERCMNIGRCVEFDEIVHSSICVRYDCALGTIAWVHISTASESALTPTARYAASMNPQIETI